MGRLIQAKGDRTMQTKTILTIAIIAALPFAAMADDWVDTWTDDGITYHTVNAPLSADDTVIQSDNVAPYQMATIGEHDDEHIATTAYVKGAYNDTIAAINKFGELVNNTQQLLINTDTNDPMGGSVFGRQTIIDEYENDLANNANLENILVSAPAVAKLVDVQRVKIYTTWDDDRASATTEVPLVVASGQ